MDKNKKKLVLMIVAILGLIVITAGVTYAFFSYTKEGTQDNTITTGTITFLYTEVSGVGKGISLTDAFPITDTQGKKLTGEGNVFDFKVTSTTPNKTAIPYEVTARKSSDSNLVEEAVRIYLTKVSGTSEEEVLLAKYDNLTQTSKVDEAKYIEKTIYTGKVPADSPNYEENFRLRMWVDEDTNFSPEKDENGNDVYPYNDKKFTITVNVYANAKVVTEEDISLESNININSLSVDGEKLNEVENKDYNYTTTLPIGTTSTAILVETENPYANVAVERLDSLVYSSNIKRLASTKEVELLPGENYFKVTVTSEDSNLEMTRIIRIMVEQNPISLTGEVFRVYPTVIEKNPNLKAISSNTDTGLYKSTATNFNEIKGTPTYYFRGNIINNYVEFAGFIWRIVRINEDGTIRLIMTESIDSYYRFNINTSTLTNMYYSKSGTDGAKYYLDKWYTENINSNLSNSEKVATGNYFCEQAKVKVYFSGDNYASGNASMTVYSNYTPTFECSPDGNGYGVVNSNIGLITYDEVVYAGSYFNKANNNYYLYNANSYRTMTPSGYSNISKVPCTWTIHSNGYLWSNSVKDNALLYPVINLKADVTVTGNGTKTNPWKVV